MLESMLFKNNGEIGPNRWISPVETLAFTGVLNITSTAAFTLGINARNCTAYIHNQNGLIATVQPTNGASNTNVTIPVGTTEVRIRTAAAPGIELSPIGTEPYLGVFQTSASSAGFVTIKDWENCQLRGMNFRGANKLTTVPSELPINLNSLASMFWSCGVFNSPVVSGWDTKYITNMSGVFQTAAAFNQPLNSWDISKVTTLSTFMFGATAYNYPLDTWDTSNVTNMSAAFRNASNFNQNLNSWNVDRVTDMNYMFGGAVRYNQPMNQWNTSNLLNMANMFNGASVFNQNLSGWNVSKVTNRTNYDAVTTAWQVANKPIFV